MLKHSSEIPRNHSEIIYYSMKSYSGIMVLTEYNEVI